MKRKRAPRRDSGRPRGAPVVEMVLQQTLVELATVGLQGLSVERIAANAEVNKTSIYRRWPTREALVAAALEGIVDGLSVQVPDTGALRGDLLALLMPVARMLGLPMGKAVFRAAVSEGAANSVAELAARKLRQQSASPVRQLIARAEARGEVRKGLKGEQLIFALVGAMIHRALLEHAPLSRAWLASLVDLMLFGALKRE